MTARTRLGGAGRATTDEHVASGAAGHDGLAVAFEVLPGLGRHLAVLAGRLAFVGDAEVAPEGEAGRSAEVAPVLIGRRGREGRETEGRGDREGAEQFGGHIHQNTFRCTSQKPCDQVGPARSGDHGKATLPRSVKNCRYYTYVLKKVKLQTVFKKLPIEIYL